MIRKSHFHPRPIHPQPFLPLPIVGHHLVYLVPKRCRVVRIANVRQLMDHDVVQHGGGRHHAFPMEVQPAARQTGCQVVLQVQNLDRLGFHRHLSLVMASPLGNHLKSDTVPLPFGGLISLIRQRISHFTILGGVRKQP